MDGEIKRGEVYWVSFDNSVGSEMRTGRPVVVVSSDGKNAKSGTIICAYTTTTTTTTTEGGNPSRVVVDYGEGRRVVLCDQLRTVDRSRFDRYVGVLTYADIKRVSGALAAAMGIPYSPTAWEPAQRVEEKDVTALRVELDTIKRQYDLVLTELVKMKVDADVNRLMSSPKVDEINTCTEEETPAPKYEVDPTPKKIEINTCTEEELRSAGCNDSLIKSIIERRPYKSVEDLRGVPSLTSVGYTILKTKVCCVPILRETKFKMQPAPNVEKAVTETGKVNMNTATYEELVCAGVGKVTAASIVDYRATRGAFGKVGDLMKVRYVGKSLYEKYAPLLEV